MNNSGICIRELIEYFKIDAQDVIVFHDDLDVEFGKIKAKFGGSSAGHNGIASIDKFIGKDYSRVRIGIGYGLSREFYFVICTVIFVKFHEKNVTNEIKGPTQLAVASVS